MSKEARATLTAGRRAKSGQFKVALDEAWNQLNDATKTIASAHHKSIRRVQNELYIGHGILRSRRTKPNMWNVFCWKKGQGNENRNQGQDTLKQLVCEHKDEYLALSKEEKEVLLKEYTNWTKTKTTGTRISTKSKIMDITQTLKAVENELNSLRCRTGAETILYTTLWVDQSSPPWCDLHNRSKMEGFAIQGMKGAAKNHKDRVSDWSSEDHWGTSCQHAMDSLFSQHRATLSSYDRWDGPTTIPFVNLSKVSSALPELERLFHLWDTCITFWKTLTDDEFAKICQEHNEKLKSGEIEDIHRRTRSDKGMEHKRLAATNSNDRNTAQCKKFKSAETIEDSDEDDNEDNGEDNGGETTPPPSPHQLSNANTTPNLTFEPSVTTPNFSTPHAAGSSLDINTHFTFPPYVPGSPLMMTIILMALLNLAPLIVMLHWKV
ncbi:hypothetical protein DFH29DRAFT_1007060 [Suillus ampliporus]|nr:hypothetical protein DFH29DRAFT_1007060 [Suillus ampliporus]